METHFSKKSICLIALLGDIVTQPIVNGPSLSRWGEQVTDRQNSWSIGVGRTTTLFFHEIILRIRWETQITVLQSITAKVEATLAINKRMENNLKIEVLGAKSLPL